MVCAILILVARTLAYSQELLIVISNGYSFPGMHHVTFKAGGGVDGEMLINRSFNTAFFPCILLLLAPTTFAFFFLKMKQPLR